MRSFLILLVAPFALGQGLYPRRGVHNGTITSSNTPGHSYTKPPPETCTGSTSFTDCPDTTKCHGQTVTWTATEGPLPCAPSITCTCVFPTAPPVLTVCPNNVTCVGQTTTWTTSTLGPSACGGTCTVELPSTGKTGPKPTTTSSAGPILNNEAGRGSAEIVAVVVAMGGALIF